MRNYVGPKLLYRVGDQGRRIAIVPDEFGGSAESHVQDVMEYQHLAVAFRARSDTNRRGLNFGGNHGSNFARYSFQVNASDTGAVESHATTLPEVIQEMLLTTTSERQGRAIDHDQAASMEKKKQEGYF